MDFLFLCLGTSITSFFMEIANELRVFKDVADAGYKIDIKRLSELGKQLNPDASKITFFSMIIPIFNIIQVFQRTIQYNNIRPMILDQLSAINALEEMSETEKQEYSKNPTYLNAFLIPLKSEIRLANASSIEIDDGNEKSVIFYEIGDSFDNITILKVDGDASRLTVDEQKKKVVDAWQKIFSAEIEKYGYIDNFMNELSNSTNLDLHHSKDDKKEDIVESTEELSISEQKQKLENLKNELLETSKSEQTSHTNNTKTLTKKRK